MFDEFEKLLEEGLLKVCKMSGLADELLSSPDLEERWDGLLKDYVADAVVNFNDYPNAALGFAAFLGMAVAAQWDRDWNHYKDKPLKFYYGEAGFDDMDDHIVRDILRLDEATESKLRGAVLSCCEATLGLIDHQHIETQTKDGFFILVRCYTAFFRIGATIELRRRGYKKQLVETNC